MIYTWAENFPISEPGSLADFKELKYVCVFVVAGNNNYQSLKTDLSTIEKLQNPQIQEFYVPDRTFHNFRASKSGDM